MTPMARFQSRTISTPMRDGVRAPISGTIPLSAFHTRGRVGSLLFVARRCLNGALARASISAVACFCSALRVSTSLVRCLVRSYMRGKRGDVRCVRGITVS